MQSRRQIGLPACLPAQALSCRSHLQACTIHPAEPPAEIGLGKKYLDMSLFALAIIANANYIKYIFPSAKALTTGNCQGEFERLQHKGITQDY